VDILTTRIWLLTKSIRIAGTYDKTNTELPRLVKETTDNELIPADNWAMFAEKGGIRGQVDLFPIEQIAAVLDKLRDCRQESLALLYQVTGFSDIIRGQAMEPGATATEQRAKTRFASVRMQAQQDEFARFASDIQRIKAEIICLHFDAETIIRRSNIMLTPDAPYAAQAVQFLKQGFPLYRVEVKPESVNLTDFAALKQERTDVMQALSGFVQSMAPVGQMLPGSVPYLLEMLKWFMSGQRDASSIESVLDRAIAQAEAMAAQQAASPAPQQPSPEQLKLQAQQMKGMQDMQKIQEQTKARLIERQADVQAKDAEEKSQAIWNTWEAQQKHRLTRGAPGEMAGVFNGQIGGIA
jgi:hypothetical protein